jgi:hypothetical protein
MVKASDTGEGEKDSTIWTGGGARLLWLFMVHYGVHQLMQSSNNPVRQYNITHIHKQEAECRGVRNLTDISQLVSRKAGFHIWAV